MSSPSGSRTCLLPVVCQGMSSLSAQRTWTCAYLFRHLRSGRISGVTIASDVNKKARVQFCQWYLGLSSTPMSVTCPDESGLLTGRAPACLQISGYQIPKGTDVILAIGSMHMNRLAWGQDARCWRPLRWLEGRSRAAMKKDSNGHNRYHPFLDGANICIGQHLAVVRSHDSRPCCLWRYSQTLETVLSRKPVCLHVFMSIG